MRKKILWLSLALVICASLLAGGDWLFDNKVNATGNVQEFADVQNSDWFYGDVVYVQKNKLMTGTSETEFSPSGVTTRGMIVTVLWRVEGEPVVEGKGFEDVSPDAWYSNAVAWASSNQIVSGYSETAFGPNDTATREQLATIMYRYASYKQCDVSKEAELDKYEDMDQISEYAVKSLKWANANGIISGTSEVTISPKDNVLRSQVAAILRRFCENFGVLKSSEEVKVEQTETPKEETKQDVDDKFVHHLADGSVIIGGGGTGEEPDEEIIPDAEEEKKEEAVENSRPALNVNTTYGDPGETIKVVVDLENNPGILGMVLQLEYNEDAMTLVGAESGNAVADVLSLTTSKDLKSGVKFVWDGLEIGPDQIKDGGLLVLEFKLAKDVIYGKRYPLSFKFNPGEIIDANLSPINPLIKQGFIEINEEKFE